MASKFAVGGGPGWGTISWANTSGGTGGQTAPTTGDSVFFDGNSGTTAFTWGVTISLATLDCTGSKNVITHAAATITISSGNLVLPTGVGGTYAANNGGAGFTFTGTSGTQQITTNGFSNIAGLTFNGVGGTFQLQDAIASTFTGTTATTLTAGTFDAQSFSVNINTFVCTGSGVRTLIGTGTWSVRTSPGGIASPWNIAGSNLTSSGFTANINFISDANQTVTRTFTGGGLTTYGTLTFSGGNTSAGPIAIAGANTFAGIAGGTLTSALNIQLPTLTTQTVTALTLAGDSSNYINLFTATEGTQATISQASGTPNMQYCVIRDIVFTGGATFTATNSIDATHSTGITITAPSGGGGPVGQQST